MPTVASNLILTFVPHLWDYVDRFAKWYGPPFTGSHALSQGLKTITGHREKFRTLAERATLLIPELAEERQLLDERGYSDLAKAKEFTAIIESLICELCSCLDGLRNTVHAIYKDVRSVQNESTEKMFSRAAGDKYGDGFPLEINDLLKSAYKDWFLDLRCLRSELTHRTVGVCTMQDDFRISYMHYGLRPKSGEHVFIIENIVDWINAHENHVNSLLNAICKFWFDQLEPREVIEICGFNQGRAIIRAVEITEPINHDSGLCLFRHAFEEEPEWTCPLRDSCAAYNRVGGDSRAVLARLTSGSEREG
ncbi:hypothetical protein H6F43_02230 [Leptolyngbya sp. FACHB-36]|uniref:hypothetical protein n=1 Tax=Leptolyngbya sp. FACHB-36 TaxID=2692808 RepID=UPI0016818E15|nr:hypothetical protein [Leptolyngbya sp. FACHB-36]MBD2019004.1 hypothetical protein [Leptolyngbya sp. FACHB-36]